MATTTLARMKQALLLPALGLLLGMSAAQPSGAQLVLDFDSLAHGDVIDTLEFKSSHGVTVTQVINFGSSGSVPNVGVGFGTSQTGTSSPTLEEGDPANRWLAGNLQGGASLGRAMIIQENDLGVAGGTASDPKADAAGGLIVFDFDSLVSEVGFDLIGVDDAQNHHIFGRVVAIHKDALGTETTVASIQFSEFSAAGPYFDPTVTYGINTANRIAPTGNLLSFGQGFNKLQFLLFGEAALDNLTWAVQPAPVPGLSPWSLLLLGFGIVFATGRGLFQAERDEEEGR